ncbi:hypothetical protein K377_07270 [Streptomyces sp. PsTaAH-137]|nr:hypothetical protein K377_07270 [Streptomyces sp. PsTaAH-137]
MPVRDGDSADWLPRSEIQQLLSSGVRASGLPPPEALTDLVRQAMSEAKPDTRLPVGQGCSPNRRTARVVAVLIVERQR